MKFEETTEDQFNFSAVIGGNLLVSIDGSSSRTGVAVFDYTGSALCGTVAVERDDNEDYVEYKIRLKRALIRLMDAHLPVLKRIFYEEPFVGFTHSTEVLMALRTTIKEIKLENAPKYDNITYTEVNNGKWKRIFLYPNKVPSGSDNQKAAVQNKVSNMFKDMASIEKTVKKTGEVKRYLVFTEDECDAIGLGIACMQTLKTGWDESELISKKKAKPFKYNIQFLVATADNQDEAECRGAESFYDYNSAWKVPPIVIDNGISIVPLNGRGVFDNHIYEAMGGDDKLLIVSFPGGKYVDTIIRNGRSDLCRDYDKNEYIIAFVWRKSRK